MSRPIPPRIEATCAVAGAAVLAGCTGASARGAGLAFWFVAVVAFAFAVGVIAVLGYLAFSLARDLLRGDGG